MNTTIPENLINGGQRTIQTKGRITIHDLMEANGLKEGDRIEVFLKKVII